VRCSQVLPASGCVGLLCRCSGTSLVPALGAADASSPDSLALPLPSISPGETFALFPCWSVLVLCAASASQPMQARVLVLFEPVPRKPASLCCVSPCATQARVLVLCATVSPVLCCVSPCATQARVLVLCEPLCHASRHHVLCCVSPCPSLRGASDSHKRCAFTAINSVAAEEVHMAVAAAVPSGMLSPAGD